VGSEGERKGREPKRKSTGEWALGCLPERDEIRQMTRRKRMWPRELRLFDEKNCYPYEILFLFEGV
jgi:hypothetical protein